MHDLARGALEGINWLAGVSSPTSSGAAASDLHCKTFAYDEGLSELQQPAQASDYIMPQVAFRELLRGRQVYDVDTASATLGSYRHDLVSLPNTAVGSPSLVEVVGDVGQSYLEDFGQRMRGSAEEVRARLQQRGPVYNDPALVRRPRTYRRFIQSMLSKGLVDFCFDPAEEVGIFFVWKKGRKALRMIIDARRANLHFGDPPHTDLLTSEGLSSFEIDFSDGPPEIFVGTSDIRDAFHRLIIPRWLRKFFALPPVRAGDVGISSLEGRPVAADALIHPVPVSLPMGFSWALFFCQETGTSLLQPLCPREQLLSDHGHTCILGGSATLVRQYLYVDNLGSIGSSRTAVEKRLGDSVGRFEAAGLEMHPSDITGGEAEVLGVVLDARRQHTRTGIRRFWKVRGAILHLLWRGRASGRMVEVIVGHATFAALVRRPTLSIFFATYRFIRANYDAMTPLWDSVKAELRAFMNCMVFWWLTGVCHGTP